MKIKTKLNMSFIILIISMVLIGFIGMITTQKVNDNFLAIKDVSGLLLLQKDIEFVLTEMIAVSDLETIHKFQDKFDRLKQSFSKLLEKINTSIRQRRFHRPLSDIFYDDISRLELISVLNINEQSIETVGDVIFTIHKEKLELHSVFDSKYSLEKEQRRKIRTVIFSLLDIEIIKEMGDIQYLSKETLYQHRDQKHLLKWIVAINNIKKIVQTKDFKLSQSELTALSDIIDQYIITAQTMGGIAIRIREIEQQENIRISELKKVLNKSSQISITVHKKLEKASGDLVTNVFRVQATLIFIVLICVFVLSTYITRSVSSSITKLKDAAEKLSNGSFEVKIAIHSKDEFSHLANVFNHMVDELKQARNLLEDANQNLEQKVRERTQELNLKNEQLSGLASKLAKYLSPQVYDSIFQGEKEVRIETYRKKLTIFFSDIKGFTQLTDSMEAEKLTPILNHYLDEMSKIALRYGGTIDKFIGDAIMIFFGDPETKGENADALNCAMMALEMRERMKYLQKMWKDQGLSETLKIRIGINTGFCTVGNFGSENRLDYTIVGGNVNLASRLESNATPDQILISHDTYALIKNQILCEEKEKIQVKGIAYPIQTYQILDLYENLTGKVDQINEKQDGFVLSIDFNKISNKQQVCSSLKKALTDIEREL
ncbi:MAG: HAMP domain-containing protein [Desulfobacteraceae bacterium]|nr:HAMP domain-containing protein [Desulfobacteraceae bacterium]